MYPYKDFGQKIQSAVDSINPDRGFIARVNFDEPDTKDISAVLSSTALTDEEQTITENITDPDVPRSLRIKGNDTGISGDVVVNGTNINDNSISETIALDGDSEAEGDKAFKTVTSIELPVQSSSGDEAQIGTGNKLGLPYKLSLNTVLKAYRDGSLEGTNPTVNTDDSNIENNTVLLDSALNGTAVDVLLIV